MARPSFPEDGGLGLGAERQCLGGGRSRRGRDASAGHSGPEREAVKSGRTEAGGVGWEVRGQTRRDGRAGPGGPGGGRALSSLQRGDPGRLRRAVSIFCTHVFYPHS